MGYYKEIHTQEGMNLGYIFVTYFSLFTDSLLSLFARLLHHCYRLVTVLLHHHNYITPQVDGGTAEKVYRAVI